MYISPFWCGVATTLVVEFGMLLLAAIFKSSLDDNKENK